MNLENDHNVYILGAGFSADAGMPLVGDFLQRMRDSRDSLRSKQCKSEEEAVEQVMQFRMRAASAAYWVGLDLENIEELFSLASTREGEMDTKIKLAIAATLDCSAYPARGDRRRKEMHQEWDMLQSWKDQNLSEKSPWLVSSNPSTGMYSMDNYVFHVARLLGMFPVGQPQGKNTFITFNYDTLVEESLRQLGLSYCYGFKRQTVNFHPDAVSEVSNASIRLLKLHGSVNWARRKGKLTVHSSYADVRKDQLIPELIPPTWKKVFDGQLEAVWSEAVKALNTATRIIVVGFSMPPTDMHFKYLLAAGLQESVSLRKVAFVNPQKDEMESRVRAVLRVPYVDSGIITCLPLRLHELTGNTLQNDHLSTFGRPLRTCPKRLIFAV